MKIAYLTQRESFDAHNQQIDSLEGNYVHLFEKLGFTVIPLSNFSKFLNIDTKQSIFVFTGGGKVSAEYYKDDYEYPQQEHRNALEKSLMDIAIKNNVPVIGICRGMQLIASYFGAKITNLETVNKNRLVGEKHPVSYGNSNYYVNHFHNDGLLIEDSSFDNLVVDIEMGLVEAFEYKSFLGIQWHPERSDDNDLGITLIKDFLRRKNR